MKTIQHGNSNAPKWWHGLQLTCPCCKAVYQLEPGDERAAFWYEQPPGEVRISCPTCWTMIHAIQPNHPTRCLVDLPMPPQEPGPVYP